MEHRRQIANTLRQARLDRGWSQELLASYAGVHPTEVSRLERGIREPRLSTVVQVAAALDIPVERLLAGSDALDLLAGPAHPNRS